MPSLSLWFIRTALLELLTGVTLGAAMLAARGGSWAPRLAGLLPLHVELLVLGWLANLVIGVAYWMLPKYPTGRERGAGAPVVAAWVALNGGLLLVGLDLFPVAGRSAELLAVLLFATNAWPRVKPFGAGRPLRSELRAKS
ncbi:MAG: hypothetical protein ACHQXA_03010 [Gemmatimonadales bacterium]